MALVLVFNGLILWTLVTVSIEWARNGSPTLSGFAKTARSVLTNPLIVGILSGTLFSLTGLPLPTFVDRPVSMLGSGGAVVAGGAGDGACRVPHQRRLAAEQRHLRAEVAGAAASDLAAGTDDGSAADGNPRCGAAGIDGGGGERLPDVAPVQYAHRPGRHQLVMSTVLAAITTPLILTVMGVRA